jgi:hypothetical protein
MMHSATNRSNRIGEVCRRIEEDDLLDWDDPEKFLTFIGVETVKVCTLSKGVRKEKNGWSPVTKGLTMNLRAIVTMLKHVNGFKANRNLQWVEENFRPGLNAILRKWRQHGGHIAHTGELKSAYLNLSRFGEGFWHAVSWGELVLALPEAYKVVKSMLHGADRSRRRMELNARTAKIEACTKLGQTGVAIRHILGPKNRGFDLSSLRIDEEEVTDQAIINDAAHLHMREWFEEKGEAMPGALGGPSAEWSDAFLPQESFLAASQGSDIPLEIRAHLWKHMQRKAVSEEASEGLKALMESEPTIEEWTARVKGLPKKSAPGPSGLTYDMIQCWSEAVHAAVLKAHVALWRNGKIPDEWVRKWLVLIPKGVGGSLDDLRPLMLIEATRKIWAGIFLGRIQAFLDANKMLHPSQHGASRGAGTDTAAPILINALETAREWGSSVYISSWDVKRAFDSISREYQVA